MQTLFRNTLAGLALAAAVIPTFAQAADAPIIEFKTTLFQNVGAENAFHFTIGAKEDTYIDVDCGYGPVEVEVGQTVFDGDAQAIVGTTVTGSVSEAGVVKIYGDASLIDYLDLEGVYITDLSFPTLTEVEVLNLNHNLLHALDLTHMTKLQALYISDNPFDCSPLIVGAPKPDLAIIDMSILDALDESFNFSDYPALVSAQVWSVPSLKTANTSGCPNLLQLSIDVTNVASVDVSNNPNLLILNVADTKVSSLDLSNNQYLTELYIGHNGAINRDCQFTSLDLTQLPNLQRLSLPGNALTSLDVSNNPRLISLSCQHNLLSSINIDNNPSLNSLDISYNYMDFATIPAERTSFAEYYYQQNPMQVARQYAVGDVIDLSERVLRPNSTTEAVLYAVSRENPTAPTLLEDEYYSYADGRLTVLKAYTDSVFVAYKNSALPEAVLTTSKFMMKEPGDIGKPSAAAAINFSAAQRNIAFKAGISGASASSPITFQVDFGDGQLVDCVATTDGLPDDNNITGTRKGTTTTVYVPEGTQLISLGIDGQRLLTMDLDNATALKNLTVNNARLAEIDLKWNYNLVNLNLDNNNLTALDLAGYSNIFTKYRLTNLSAANNKLESFSYEDGRTFTSINLSNNALKVMPLGKMANLVTLDLSGNSITDINLRDCEALVTANLSSNLLTALPLPDYVPLTSLNISENNFTFAALPEATAVVDYTYAPQRPIAIPAKAPVISLAQYLFGEGADATTFTWKMADTGADVAEGNIREANGRFFFDNPDLGVVYCELANPAFPQFTGENILKTTAVQTAPMPTRVFASYTPAEDGNVTLTLTGAQNGVTVYVDWTGLGDFEQLILQDSYLNFPGTASAGNTAKLYSYDENEGVTVFSYSGVKLSSIDASPMKGLIAFGVYNAGLAADNIALPESALKELSLPGNNIDNTAFIAQYPSLKMLSIGYNPLTTIDVTSLKALETFYAPNCGLTTVALDNPLLWEAALVNNEIADIDLSKVPDMRQLLLSNNKLTQIDFSAMTALRAVTIDANYFTLATLPLPSNAYYQYNYLNQHPLAIEAIGGRVDLSSQATVAETPTVFRWFIDAPYLDEEGELYGEELIEGEEYTVENGVTTFLNNFTHIMCVMTNERFPGLYYTTEFIDVESSGIEDIVNEATDAPVEYYNLQGIRVANPGPGIYIRRQANHSTKIKL